MEYLISFYVIEVWIVFDSFVSLTKSCGYLPVCKDKVVAAHIFTRTHSKFLSRRTVLNSPVGMAKMEKEAVFRKYRLVESFMFSRFLCSSRYPLASKCKPSSRIIRLASARCHLHPFLLNIETSLCSPHLLRGPRSSWNA